MLCSFGGVTGSDSVPSKQRGVQPEHPNINASYSHFFERHGSKAAMEDMSVFPPALR